MTQLCGFVSSLISACVLQSCCQICREKFPSDDAVFTHLNSAHPSASIATFVTSRRGFSMLVHHDYLYTLNASRKDVYHWNCSNRKCPGRASTRGRRYDDVTSIVKVSPAPHSHPPSAAKVRLYDAMESLRQQALESDASPLALRQKLFASIERDVAALLPSAQNMARLVSRWRNKASHSSNKSY